MAYCYNYYNYVSYATVVTVGVAGVGVGRSFVIGFSGSAIGSGDSGLAVTVASSVFTGAVVRGTISFASDAIYSGI